MCPCVKSWDFMENPGILKNPKIRENYQKSEKSQFFGCAPKNSKTRVFESVPLLLDTSVPYYDAPAMTMPVVLL